MPAIQQVTLADEQFFRMTDSDHLRPFFMSIVSDGNHWMFLSSNGGLTAGRKNAAYALFPYYTDDKITESADITGSKTIFRIAQAGQTVTWEPFADRYRGQFAYSRNLYKSVYGNSIIFEEINHDLQLRFRYRWQSSNRYGFVRTSQLTNLGAETRDILLVDGLQNLLPYGVESELQQRASNLVDAYKRNELDTDSGLGIFALSAIIVDKAEPSEALKANVAWSVGLDQPQRLVSSLQLDAFREGGALRGETDVKGEKGAYFVHQSLSLPAGDERQWRIVANVNQDHAGVIALREALRQPQALEADLMADVVAGTRQLIALSAAADGLQQTGDSLRDSRHFSNVLFNIMRGGTFDHNYDISRRDFSRYLQKANPAVFQAATAYLEQLPEVFPVHTLRALLTPAVDADFRRLAQEYLPLKFSRRHGDPSRPWNRFSINTTSEEDGSPILDYEGNWRDIFQNWESLAFAFPEFIEGMIAKFLNASTFDGYNPYRVTRSGFDWETIEADDPWSYIGYWGDHQVIYLLKFLEFSERHQPGQLAKYFTEDLFVYANVPYRIRPYADLLANPDDTIDFDHALDARIRQRREAMGADGALLTDRHGAVCHVNFIEKLLASLLAKLANFIPEGGIWMNTQRPEWNDANNALVGNGVSMVTLYYLRRFVAFCARLLADSPAASFPLSAELADYRARVHAALTEHRALLRGPIDDRQRRAVLDALGGAASDFRQAIYTQGFSGERQAVTTEQLVDFLTVTLDHLDHCVAANQRPDKLFHAYNLMTPTQEGITISYLSEMLEGQVAALSLGNLSPTRALAVMDALRASALYRPDQDTYILYPDKQLPGFLDRNTLPAAAVEETALLRALVADGHRALITRDVTGGYHFNGNFRNAKDVARALDQLEGTAFAEAARADRQAVLDLFEQVFNHKEFTGRSGTFFGYEGLGSIYWHMVSKLLLAVQECHQQAVSQGADPEVIRRLAEHYHALVAGVGVHKPPQQYGAFPTDPYSHTPAGRGAQQPGMTGQVKEDILTRIGEFGASVQAGRLRFAPRLLAADAFGTDAGTFAYVATDGTAQQLALPPQSLCFTYCQVPVVYTLTAAATPEITVVQNDGSQTTIVGDQLPAATSQQLFDRAGTIRVLRVQIPTAHLLS